MASRAFSLLALTTLIFFSAIVSAMERPPETVSPGELVRVVQIRDGCPTFSWGAVPDAAEYELLIYALGAEAEKNEPEAVMKKNLPGSVFSWSPSLETCLQGGRYAWVVRALAGEDLTDWSDARLFEVARGPSEADLERALEVVRRYLTERGQTLVNIDQQAAQPESETREKTENTVTQKGDVRSLALNGAPFVIDGSGNVQAVSFTGDGSALTNVTASPIGAAGGDLTGSYPNPGLATGSVVVQRSIRSQLLQAGSAQTPDCFSGYLAVGGACSCVDGGFVPTAIAESRPSGIATPRNWYCRCVDASHFASAAVYCIKTNKQ